MLLLFNEKYHVACSPCGTISPRIVQLASEQKWVSQSEWYMIDSRVRQVRMSPWLFNVYMDGVIKKMKMGIGRRGEIVGGWERIEIA